MKKIIFLFLLLFVNFTNSQTIARFLENSHIANKDSISYLKIDKISLKNGLGDYKNVGIILNCNKKQLEKLTIEKLNMIVLQTNSKAKYSLKNPSTYSPLKISIFFSKEKNEWISKIDYTGQNGYGATLDSKLFVIFDESGEFKSQM